MKALPTLAVILLAAAISSCSDNSSTAPTTAQTADTSPTSTAPAVTTTTRPATTTPAPTTTRATTTTLPAEPPAVAIVWESAVDSSRVNMVDPAPTANADGVTVTLQLAIYVPADGKSEMASQCREEIDFQGDPALTHCMTVQVSMDVDADFRTDEYSPDAGVSIDALITPAGKQYGSVFAASGYPGTVDTVLSVIIAGGEPGSTIKVMSGSNLVGWTTHTFVLPGSEAFAPAMWVA